MAGVGFGRVADPSRLKANSPSMFTLDELQKEVDLLLHASGMGVGCAKVLGKGLGKKFYIQFQGAGQLGARHAQKFVDTCLKDDDGKWIPLHIKDPQGIPNRLFVGPDVGPQQERIEILTGILSKVVGEIKGGTAFAQKREGVVFFNFVPVASITVPDSKTVELSINSPGCLEVGLNTAEVKRMFEERTSRRAPKWTQLS